MTGQQRGGRSSRGANQIAAQVEPVVRQAVEGVGFELEALDVQQAGRRRLVKVVIDAEDGASGAEGVGLDEIAEVSRTVSTALDAADDLLAGAYTLEVTSPGVDRPLTKPRHWRRARLRLAKITLTDGTGFTARIGDAGDGSVQVLRDGALRTLAYADIERAVVEVEFRQPPDAEVALLDGSADRGDQDGHGRKDSQVKKEES